MKDRPEQVGQTMQAMIEATSVQQMRYIALLVQKAVDFRSVAAKVQGGCQRNGQDFGIADPALVIFSMVKFFQG